MSGEVRLVDERGLPVGLPYVVVTGADQNGTLDSTAAFMRAMNSLGSRRGVVFVPPGKYAVQGLPLKSGLYWCGAGHGSVAGADGTYLTLPGSPSASAMFVASPDGSGDLYGSGVKGMYAAGGQNKATATIDFIDCSPITNQCHDLMMDAVWMDGWRRCYNGSSDDRSIIPSDCHFWNSTEGLRIANNHFKLTKWNDFRSNTYGIRGFITDAFICNQQFVGNDIGIGNVVATSGLTANVITACTFFQSTTTGIQLGVGNTVTGCQFQPPQAGAPTLLTIQGSNNNISGCMFTNGSSGTGVVTNGCITFDCDSNPQTIFGVNITGSSFKQLNSAVLYHLASAGSRDLVNIGFIGNNLIDPGRFYVRSGAFGAVFGSGFDNNVFRLENTSIGAGVDLVSITNANTVGNTYNGNKFYGFAGAVLRYAIGGDLTQSVITGNYIRRTSGIDPAASATAVIANNNWQP